MMFSQSLVSLSAAALLVLPHVSAHGVVTSPAPRTTGSASEAACGTAVTKKLASDKYGPIQDAQDKADSGYDEAACSIYFCRGYKYEDNEDKLQTYAVGDVVDFKVDMEAHHTGIAVREDSAPWRTELTDNTPSIFSYLSKSRDSSARMVDRYLDTERVYRGCRDPIPHRRRP